MANQMRRMPDTIWHKVAEQQGIPIRTLDQVKETLAIAKSTKADAAMARIMIRFGRMTDEACEYLAREYPQ